MLALLLGIGVPLILIGLLLLLRSDSPPAPPGTAVAHPPAGSATLGANPALVLIDIQQGLDDPRLGRRNNPDAERQIATLLAAWRAARWPVIHVQHMSRNPDSPLRPDRPGNAFKPEAEPRAPEPVFQKTTNSAFVGTALEAHLRSHGVDTLVLAGLTTDHCVSATARTASDLGFTTIVVSDATATFERTGPDGDHHDADEMHRSALASLHGEFATVRRTDAVLAELGPSDAP